MAFIRVMMANTQAGEGIVNTDHIAFIGQAPDGSVQISMSTGLTFPILHTLATIEVMINLAVSRDGDNDEEG